MQRQIRLAIAAVLLFHACASSLYGADGQQIMQEASNRDTGYGDYKAGVIMTMREKIGNPMVRKMDIMNREFKSDGFRTVVVFNSPSDVKGSKVLTASHSAKDDEQWIFLPAFNRVKQISDANKSSSFMGSEFTYEDINAINIQVPKFSYKYLKNEMVSGVQCFVLERKPKYNHSSYIRQVVWVDATDYVIRKVEYYDRENKLLKTLTVSGYDRYLNRYFRAREMTMLNHRNGKSTLLQWSGYVFRNGLSEGDLSVASLKR